jgi:hypothetical protein
MDKLLSSLITFIGLLLIVTGIYASLGHLEHPNDYFVPGLLFLLIGFLNKKIGRNVKPHHIPFVISTIVYFILIAALVIGELPLKRHHYIRSIDPQGFWENFTLLFLFGTAALCYGVWQLRKSR